MKLKSRLNLLAYQINISVGHYYEKLSNIVHVIQANLILCIKHTTRVGHIFFLICRFKSISFRLYVYKSKTSSRQHQGVTMYWMY